MQAINVIYKLAEHPDALCGRLIKNLARAVLMDPTGPKVALVPNKDDTDEGKFVLSISKLQISRTVQVLSSQMFPTLNWCHNLYIFLLS